MKVILGLIMICFFSSCATAQVVPGKYHKQGKDFSYDLTLNKDSTFTLSKKYFEANASCSGKWRLIAKDTLLLKCAPVDISTALSAGHIDKSEQKVMIDNKNRIKMGDIVLYRVQ